MAAGSYSPRGEYRDQRRPGHSPVQRVSRRTLEPSGSIGWTSYTSFVPERNVIVRPSGDQAGPQSLTALCDPSA